MKTLRIAVGRDTVKWHERFVHALETKKSGGYPLDYQVVNLEKHDWIDQIKAYDLILWKPFNIGPRSSGFIKEKIYFAENYLGKIVMPNYSTIWHFESKIAQSYIFKEFGVPSPYTAVSFDVDDSKEQAEKIGLPLVFKRSYGASSKNVRLIRKKKAIKLLLEREYFQIFWDSVKKTHTKKIMRILSSLFKRWFWFKIKQKIFNEEQFGYTYFQRFVPGNNSDLRITVIGDRFAYGFWRNNRRNDFRASGSGNLDFKRPIPEEVIHFCMKLNGRLNFDSMAYDILFDGKDFVISEMSYGYIDFVPNDSARYYILDGDGLIQRDQKIWPQELWVEWALHKVEKKYSESK